MKRSWITLACLALCMSQPVSAASRIKDITTLQGIRDNQLVGYGLVIGLAGTGDSLRSSAFTEISMRSMLQRMGVGLGENQLQSKNVAAVVVTAILPPFVTQGARIDATVSSLGDATSLGGGTLIMTPLVAANGEAYAVAQGSVTINGFKAEGRATSVAQGVATTGRLPNGAIVERDHVAEMNSIPHFTLQLHNPDFATAHRVADQVNAFSSRAYGMRIAEVVDFRSIRIARPSKVSATKLMADVGQLSVEVDALARIVVDERNGTIVMGENVRILPVAISHGSLTIRITEDVLISQPKPDTDGATAAVRSTDIQISQPDDPVAILRGPTLEKLVQGLNRMGLKPPEITSILQSIKSAGALQAELLIQ
jgi:flagellar P-ring protein FlgI